ncbi:toxin-antitoxin system YwqK family antitoxin, partial [Umezakia ovalisporum]|uniref:toxin-antitoxin system YwqK family antitoxin n=1 Tax=Umezakia ovalisporum TaxID=75695 RepID=UPI0039C63554
MRPNFIEIQDLYEKEDGKFYSFENHQIFNGILIKTINDYRDTILYIEYKNGKAEGQEIRYYQQTKLQVKAFYHEGLYENEYVGYYENGNLKESGQYKTGNEVGLWKTYFSSGKLFMIGKYNDGNKIGKWSIYNPDGTFNKIECYDKNCKLQLVKDCLE